MRLSGMHEVICLNLTLNHGAKDESSKPVPSTLRLETHGGMLLVWVLTRHLDLCHKMARQIGTRLVSLKGLIPGTPSLQKRNCKHHVV